MKIELVRAVLQLCEERHNHTLVTKSLQVRYFCKGLWLDLTHVKNEESVRNGVSVTYGSRIDSRVDSCFMCSWAKP